jgi:2-(1,2-epoxy-1,2-dihydrophenyl)acetyl-CoA isomerase
VKELTSFESITYAVETPLAFIVMNRPERHNAISLLMMRELRSAFERAEANASVHVIILAGAGSNSFSSGIDLKGGILDDAGGITDSMQSDLLPLLECMHQSSKLIIAGVDGAAIGLGCSLALHCDLLAMADDATLNLSFSKLGLIADGGINWLLPHKVGYGRALQIVLEAQVLDAARCEELGIANRVMRKDQMAHELREWATKLAANAPLAQGLTKQLMRDAMAGNSLTETVCQESVAQARCAGSSYFKRVFAGILGR